MRLPSVSHVQSWVLARMERLWSKLAPRRQASEIAAVAVDAVRSRRELVGEIAATIRGARPPPRRTTIHSATNNLRIPIARWYRGYEQLADARGAPHRDAALAEVRERL